MQFPRIEKHKREKLESELKCPQCGKWKTNCLLLVNGLVYCRECEMALPRSNDEPSCPPSDDNVFKFGYPTLPSPYGGSPTSPTGLCISNVQNEELEAYKVATDISRNNVDSRYNQQVNIQRDRLIQIVNDVAEQAKRMHCEVSWQQAKMLLKQCQYTARFNTESTLKIKKEINLPEIKFDTFDVPDLFQRERTFQQQLSDVLISNELRTTHFELHRQLKISSQANLDNVVNVNEKVNYLVIHQIDRSDIAFFTTGLTTLYKLDISKSAISEVKFQSTIMSLIWFESQNLIIVKNTGIKDSYELQSFPTKLEASGDMSSEDIPVKLIMINSQRVFACTSQEYVFVVNEDKGRVVCFKYDPKILKYVEHFNIPKLIESKMSDISCTQLLDKFVMAAACTEDNKVKIFEVDSKLIKQVFSYKLKKPFRVLFVLRYLFVACLESTEIRLLECDHNFHLHLIRTIDLRTILDQDNMRTFSITAIAASSSLGYIWVAINNLGLNQLLHIQFARLSK